MDIPEARSLFPGARGQVYLDVALNGLMPSSARDAAVRHMEARVMGRTDKEDLHARAERVRRQVATLLGAGPDEIAITKNTSEGLNLFATNLDWEAGDNVVLCPGLEHPNNVFLWYNLGRLRGVEIREVPPEDGHIPVARMMNAMDSRTRVVTASHVTFSPGFVTDIATLAREARARGILTLVDSAQSAGAVETDVSALQVDALALGAQKSLLSFYGLGFLYIRRELADRLHPIQAARYSMDLGPGAHETAVTRGDMPFHAGARRFELSNYSYVALAALEASLELILGLGVPTIQEHGRRLAARLTRGLLEMGLPVAGGVPGPHLAHIVSVGNGTGGRQAEADDPAMNALFRHLSGNGVRLSIRRGTLRMSLGLYNNDEDVERVLALCRKHVS